VPSCLSGAGTHRLKAAEDMGPVLRPAKKLDSVCLFQATYLIAHEARYAFFVRDAICLSSLLFGTASWAPWNIPAAFNLRFNPHPMPFMFSDHRLRAEARVGFFRRACASASKYYDF